MNANGTFRARAFLIINFTHHRSKTASRTHVKMNDVFLHVPSSSCVCLHVHLHVQRKDEEELNDQNQIADLTRSRFPLFTDQGQPRSLDRSFPHCRRFFIICCRPVSHNCCCSCYYSTKMQRDTSALTAIVFRPSFALLTCYCLLFFSNSFRVIQTTAAFFWPMSNSDLDQSIYGCETNARVFDSLSTSSLMPDYFFLVQNHDYLWLLL